MDLPWEVENPRAEWLVISFWAYFLACRAYHSTRFRNYRILHEKKYQVVRRLRREACVGQGT